MESLPRWHDPTVVICTLGDALLDVVVHLNTPLAHGGDAVATTRLRPGGQAANVAAWVAWLGGTARCIAMQSDDASGRLVAEELRTRGVQLCGPTVAAGTGTVVALVDATGERTMATDVGVGCDLRADVLEPAWFTGCDRLHISGYALMRSPIDGAALHAGRHLAAMGAAADVRVSVDLSSWSFIKQFGPKRLALLLDELRPHTVFTNEEELDALGDRPTCEVLVVKLGHNGVTVHSPDGTVHHPAEPATAIDTTGAGDAFAAGYLLGTSLDDGVRRGLAAAATCITTIGGVPPGSNRGVG